MAVTFSSRRRGFLAGAVTSCAWLAHSTVNGAQSTAQVPSPAGTLKRDSRLSSSSFCLPVEPQTIKSDEAVSIVFDQSENGVTRTVPVAKLLKIPTPELQNTIPCVESLSLMVESHGAWQLKARASQRSVFAADARRAQESQIQQHAIRLKIRLIQSERTAGGVATSSNSNMDQVLSLGDVWLQPTSDASFAHRGFEPKLAKLFRHVSHAEFEITGRFDQTSAHA